MSDELTYEECRAWAEKYAGTPFSMLAFTTAADGDPSPMLVMRPLLMAETDPAVRDAVTWARHWRTVELKAECDRLRQRVRDCGVEKENRNRIILEVEGERDRLREALERLLYDAASIEHARQIAKDALGQGSEGENGD